MTEPHVQVRGVTKIFPASDGAGEIQALGLVDLDFAKGEFVATWSNNQRGTTWVAVVPHDL